jgi:hypothetical protein
LLDRQVGGPGALDGPVDDEGGAREFGARDSPYDMKPPASTFSRMPCTEDIWSPSAAAVLARLRPARGGCPGRARAERDGFLAAVDLLVTAGATRGREKPTMQVDLFLRESPRFEWTLRARSPYAFDATARTEAARAHNMSFASLVAEVKRATRSSKDVLVDPQNQECPASPEDNPRHVDVERRRGDELSPDILGLLASVGETIRKTDRSGTGTPQLDSPRDPKGA